MLYHGLTAAERRLLARLIVLRRVPNSPVAGFTLIGRVSRDLERYPDLLTDLHGGKPVGPAKVLGNLVRDGLVEHSPLRDHGPVNSLTYWRTIVADELEAGLATMRPGVVEALDELRVDSRELLDALAGE